MSRPRSSRRVPFGLFAFQDIIMAVTGIMLLFTLLLAVHLSQRSPPEPVLATQQMLQDSRQITSEIQQQLSDLQSNYQTGQETASDIAGFTEPQLKRECEDLQSEIERIDSDLESAGHDQTVTTERLEDISSAYIDRQQDFEEIESINEKIEDIEGELSHLIGSDEIIFSHSGLEGRRVWLAVIEGSKCRIKPLDFEGNATVVRASQPGTMAKRFLNWINGNLSRQEDYLLILVRPSGIEVFDALAPDMRTIRLQYGVDLLGEEQSVAGF